MDAQFRVHCQSVIIHCTGIPKLGDTFYATDKYGQNGVWKITFIDGNLIQAEMSGITAEFVKG